MYTTDICKQQIKVKTATPTTKNYKVKDTRDRIRYMPNTKQQTPVLPNGNFPPHLPYTQLSQKRFVSGNFLLRFIENGPSYESRHFYA